MKQRISSAHSSSGGAPSSDCGIMASGSTDAVAAQEPSDVAEECQGKKKSKFQTFKNFFAKKKRKEPPASPVVESGLKSSQSSEDVNTPEPASICTDKDSDSGSKINLGNKALSHDSVFASESPSSETNEALRASQDSIHGKVKSLQLQLKQAIRLGSPPANISMRKCEDTGAISEDDGLPCSPPEYSTLHTVLATSSQRSSGVVQRTSSLSLEGTDSDDDQMSYGTSSRPGTPQACIPVDFSQPASSLSCLDSSAAHHRIAVTSRACTKRKPASREILQGKRRDLRERVLLRDTEDKLRAVRTSSEAEENEAVSENIEEVDEAHEKSQPSLESQNEEELLTSSQSQRASTTSAASAETSEEEKRIHDQDHVPNFEIPESSWEKPVTLELQADDFLLDAGCEVVSEEQGSLLEEVLSSLKGPLTSGLVLEPERLVEQMEAEDELDYLVEDATTDSPTDQNTAKEEERTPVLDTLPEMDKHQQEIDEHPQREEEPEEEECADEAPLEDEQVPEMEVEKEDVEEENDRKYLEEEIDGESENVPEVVDEVEEVDMNEDEEKKMEVNMAEEEEREDEDAVDKIEVLDFEKEEEVLVEEIVKEEIDEPEPEEDEIETKEETCELEASEECEVEEEMSVEIESIQEVDTSVKDEVLVTTEIVNQPDDLPEQEITERPSFVVTTSLDLSFPSKVSNIPKQPEDKESELEEEEPNEEHGIVEEPQEEFSESLQWADDRLEVHEILSEQQSTTESRPRFTISTAWERSLSSGSAKEAVQDVSVSVEEDELVFKESPSIDQPVDVVKVERPASPVQTQSVQSLPAQREMCQVSEEPTPENPFGVRLRKTAVLHRYASEGESLSSPTQTEPVEMKSPVLEQLARKPALPKKPEQLVDGVVKPKRSSDVALGKASVETSDSPSWISVARQKQKIFSSLEESPEKQEEFNKKGSLPDLSSPVTKDPQKPVASPVKVSCSLEISKPALVEKENKRSLSHPTPAPLAQDEPPWLALAKKKAKAWSEMPQIVQ